LVAQVNDSNGHPISGVTVAFAVASGGGTVGSPSVVTGVSGQAQTTWTLGASFGAQSVTASVIGVAAPATFTATGMPATGPARVEAFTPDLSGLAGYGVNFRPAVRVTDAAGRLVSNVAVTFAVQSGGGSIVGGAATTNTLGFAQVGRWVLSALPGVNTVTATVSGAGIVGNPVTFTDTAVAATYPITVRFFGPPVDATVQEALDSAVAKWRRIIYRGLTPVTLNVAARTACGDTSAPAINMTTTGLVILAKFDSIDGPGNVLGEAGPCQLRSGSGLTVLGLMHFDVADIGTVLGSGSIQALLLHEMGHVIGFGTLWDQPPNSCLVLPSASGTFNDTYFDCAQARAEFDSIGGTSYTGASLSPPGGNKVPVENCGASSPAGCGAGTRNGHWREPVFGTELMTGYLNAGLNPLSVVTAAAQGDLGYTVNYDGADAYARTFTAPAAGGAAPLFLGDDIWRGRLIVVDRAGRVVRVLRP
jgi:hypothetical protein